jgi:GST-like protein
LETAGPGHRAVRNVKRWLERVLARPAVDRAIHIRVEEASQVDIHDPKVRAVLFGQRAR